MNADQTMFFSPMKKDPETGDTVQGYLLGALLGRGAHGAVYRARKPGDAHEYAIKIINTQGQPAGFVDRILRECAISIRLRHPDIIAVHEAGNLDACIYIVMDLAVGKAGDRYTDGGLGWELAVKVVRRVAMALEYAYTTHEIIHRDIKPGNIVLDIAGGELRLVKVVDFGLSRSIEEEEGEALTMTGMILGTPNYMSPEQARGERDLTFATDLYALGATLFHLVAGRAPFPDGSPIEILVKHCQAEPPRLRDVTVKCPTQLSDVVARCLAKPTAARYPSYAAFAAALDQVLRDAPDPFEGRSGGAGGTPTSRHYARTKPPTAGYAPAPEQQPPTDGIAKPSTETARKAPSSSFFTKPPSSAFFTKPPSSELPQPPSESVRKHSTSWFRPKPPEAKPGAAVPPADPPKPATSAWARPKLPGAVPAADAAKPPGEQSRPGSEAVRKPPSALYRKAEPDAQEQSRTPASVQGSDALAQMYQNRVKNLTSSYRLKAHMRTGEGEGEKKPGSDIDPAGQAQLVPALGRTPVVRDPPSERVPSTVDPPAQLPIVSATDPDSEGSSVAGIHRAVLPPGPIGLPPQIKRMPVAPKYSLPNGTKIDALHEVVGPIGAGAMGEVYTVCDSFMKRKLALKIMFPEYMGKPGAVQRFQAEASALATVNHQAFPYLAGKGTFQERDYLMMELVSGIDLKGWMAGRGGRMTEQEGLWTILQLARAMGRAYTACGMVHRDIKPANLMFDDSPQYMNLKIIDFGISTYIDYGDYDDYSEQEYKYIDDGSDGKAVGTPAYMSPEQCIGAPPSPLMDVYAIGCTFFHLVTGNTPYQAKSAPAMMMKHMHDPLPVFAGHAEVTSGSEYILKRCLAKLPKERFKNYQQLIDAIKTAYTNLSMKLKKQQQTAAEIFDGRY